MMLVPHDSESDAIRIIPNMADHMGRGISVHSEWLGGRWI